MELINHTPFPALMFRAGLDDNKYAMSVAVRVTYDLVDGNAILNNNEQWKLERQLWQSEYGPIESDDVFRRGGVDILVFGSAKAPNGLPTNTMHVEVKFNGKTINKIAIFGDRIWEKSFRGINISVPKPFREMPVNLANAFGGQAEFDGLLIPHGNNPFGKGYNYAKEDYIGKPLPNIENPDKLIQKWTDQPDPVGIACLPQLCELHMRDNIIFDKEGQLTKFGPKFFNTAFPAMIIEKIGLNDTIEITGMSATSFLFKVPYQKIIIKASMGEKCKTGEMYIEQVGLIIDKKQAFITYRYPFNYTVIPHEIRKCEISL